MNAKGWMDWLCLLYVAFPFIRFVSKFHESYARVESKRRMEQLQFMLDSGASIYMNGLKTGHCIMSAKTIMENFHYEIVDKAIYLNDKED